MEYIKAGRLIDGCGNISENMILCIDEGKFKGILKAEQLAKEVAVTDYSAYTIMPGLINAHIHAFSPCDQSNEEEQARSPLQKAYDGERFMHDLLYSGVTAARSLGSEGTSEQQLRDCIHNDTVLGPDLVVCGRVITMSGGHGWSSGLESDGIDECRKNTRILLREGADVIKIMATGGVMTKGVEPGSAQLTMEEMKVCVEEAHKAGKKTATHAQGNQGIRNALDAGIDSIEHGIYLDDVTINQMLMQGTYLVPTLAAPKCIVDHGEGILPDYVMRKSHMVIDAHVESFKRAYAAGVKIAVGTDAGTPYNAHSKTSYELELMVEYGVTPMDAITFATHNSAECLGIEKTHGTIEVGKFADMIVLEKNPLEDITALRNVNKVYKHGVLVLNQ